MKICVSGASGLVGAEFGRLAADAGHEIIPMVRNKQQEGVYWNVESGEIDRDRLSEADAVVHLAAESIADGRWNAAKKSRIHNSREQGTKLIAETLASIENGPPNFDLRVGHRLLREPRRRSPFGRCVDRFDVSRRSLPGLGGGVPAGNRQWYPNRQPTNRTRPE